MSSAVSSVGAVMAVLSERRPVSRIIGTFQQRQTRNQRAVRIGESRKDGEDGMRSTGEDTRRMSAPSCLSKGRFRQLVRQNRSILRNMPKTANMPAMGHCRPTAGRMAWPVAQSASFLLPASLQQGMTGCHRRRHGRLKAAIR